MIFKTVVYTLIAIEAISLIILTTTFGSLFLFFEQSLRWHISPALHFGLPISVAVICQLSIGLIIFKDVKTRVWSDEIKCDLWASLGRPEYVSFNTALYMFPLLSIAYFLIIMTNDPNVNWWREKKRSSAIFRMMTHRAVMDAFSKFTATAPWAFLAGILLFAVGGALNSDRLSLLGLQICGGMIILLPPVFAIFHFFVLTHFLSHEWVDHSYELFYDKYPIGFWPKHDWLNTRRYYRTIVRNESSEIRAGKQ